MPSKEELLKIVNDLSQQSVRDELSRLRKQNRSAIYYLFDNDEIVYIGQSTCVFSRIHTHIVEGKKDFNGFAIMNTDRKLLNKVEAEEIITHRPKHNQWATLPKNDTYMTIAQIKKRSGKSTREIKKAIRAKNATGTVINGIIYYRVEWTSSNPDNTPVESQRE